MGFNVFSFKSPCVVDGKPCPKRHVGCQIDCKELIDAQKKWAEQREKERKINREVCEYQSNLDMKYSKKQSK